MGSTKTFCYFSWEMQNLDELHRQYSSTLQYTNFVLSVIICIIGLLGNGIVIFATGFIVKKLQSKIWFLNLAVADFVFLMCLPLDAAADLKGNWPFGSLLCKTYNFFSFANTYASIFIIMALNIDRALAVAKPIWHHKFFSLRARYYICSLMWSVTMLSSVPAIIFSGEIQIAEQTQCSLFNVEELEFSAIKVDGPTLVKSVYTQIFTTFTHYLKQCTGFQCCATENAIVIWNHMVFSTKCLVIPLVVIGYFIPLCVILTSNIIIAVNVRKSKSVNSSRLYMIIITVFMVHLLTWTPLVIAQIILLVAVQNMNVILVFKVTMLLPLLSTISFISTSLNPILYVLVGSQVRNRLTDYLSSVRNRLSFGSRV